MLPTMCTLKQEFLLSVDLVTKGASIILISSDIEEILGMFDRVLVLADGQISGEFSRNEATKDAIMYKSTIKNLP